MSIYFLWISFKTFPFIWGFHRYHSWTNLSKNVGVVSERTSGKTSGQTNGRTDRRLHSSNNVIVRQKVFLPLNVFLCIYLFWISLKTFPFIWGFYRYHLWTNLSENVGVVSERTSGKTSGKTSGQTNGRTDRRLL